MRKHADMLSHEALQGAFAEHQVMLKRLSLKQKVFVVLVRSEEDLLKCDALILPGGGTVYFCNMTSLYLSSRD